MSEAGTQVAFQVQTNCTQPNCPNHDGVPSDLIWHELPIGSFTVYFLHNLEAASLECGHRHCPPHPLGITAEVLVPVSLTLGTTHKIVSGGGKMYFENL